MFLLILTVLTRDYERGYFKKTLLRTISIRGNIPKFWMFGFTASGLGRSQGFEASKVLSGPTRQPKVSKTQSTFPVTAAI